MSALLRIILISASAVTCVYISRKLKKAQVDTHDTIFWILFSAVLILVSVFPRIADRLAQTLGIYSTENTVFLIIIFALLLRVFLLTIRSSQIEHRVRVLVEELAIREKEQQAKKKRWVKPEMTVCETRRKEADGSEREKRAQAKTGAKPAPGLTDVSWRD